MTDNTPSRPPFYWAEHSPVFLVGIVGVVAVIAFVVHAPSTTSAGYAFASNNSTDTTPPIILGGNTSVTDSLAILFIYTDEVATCRYGTVDVSYSSMPNAFSATGSTMHTATVQNLQPQTAYTFYVRCMDSAGNANTASYVLTARTTVDVTPPNVAITNPSAGASVFGNTVFAVSTADNVGVVSVTYFIDGTQVAQTATPPFTASWNSGSVAAGPHTLTAFALDAAGNGRGSSAVSFSVVSAPDTTPPILSGGQPTGVLPAGTTITTLSLFSNEAAVCKWANIASAYSAMPNVFSVTGGTTHTTTLTGLVGGSYVKYVRCSDVVGNVNTVDYPIAFSVATALCGNGVVESGEQCDGSNLNNQTCVSLGFTGGSLSCTTTCTFNTASCTNNSADTTPPVISNGQPTGILPKGTKSVTMRVTTDEAAACRWSTKNVAYSSMTNKFSTTGGTSHNTLVTGLANGKSYKRFVRCRDASGNTNPSSYLISFSVSNTGAA